MIGQKLLTFLDVWERGRIPEPPVPPHIDLVTSAPVLVYREAWREGYARAWAEARAELKKLVVRAVEDGL